CQRSRIPTMSLMIAVAILSPLSPRVMRRSRRSGRSTLNTRKPLPARCCQEVCKLTRPTGSAPASSACVSWAGSLRLRLYQPASHAHLAVHRGRGRQMFLGLRSVASAAVHLAEAEVAVGDEGAHAELGGECQGLAVVAFGVPGAACRRDVTGEAEGVGL